MFFLIFYVCCLILNLTTYYNFTISILELDLESYNFTRLSIFVQVNLFRAVTCITFFNDQTLTFRDNVDNIKFYHDYKTKRCGAASRYGAADDLVIFIKCRDVKNYTKIFQFTLQRLFLCRKELLFTKLGML
jgi:hypothetical protein